MIHPIESPKFVTTGASARRVSKAAPSSDLALKIHLGARTSQDGGDLPLMDAHKVEIFCRTRFAIRPDEAAKVPHDTG